MRTAIATAEAVRSGQADPRDVVTEALRRIDGVEADIHAWVHVDREGARSAATTLLGPVTGTFPLAGVPVGIKDIIDVAGLVTTAGARPFAHYRAERDADAVTRLRAAGAIILGKTATTEFAYLDPSPTRNPWNTDHTPGGSSSGSAAAVAAGMVPVALGTQTVGSVLRPAAYCGVVGLKPGYGWTSTAGIIPLAWSLDHVGVFARTVADAALVHDVLATVRPSPETPAERLVLGIPRAFLADRASDEVARHLVATAASLAAAGIDSHEIPFPTPDDWAAAGLPVLAAEASAYHQALFDQHHADYGPSLKALIERGLGLSATDYIRAQRARAGLRDRIVSLFAEVDALLLPVAPTTAPAGLASTGDSVFCAPASYAGLPAVSLPSGLGDGGLPLAVQLVGRPGGEVELLALAGRVEAVLAFEAAASREL